MKKTIAILLCILGITAFVYIPSLNNSFTDWDDDKYVLENRLVQELTFSNVKEIFLELRPQRYLYNPLSILSFSLEHYFFQFNPRIYHINNLILHLSNTVLVFWLIFLLAGRLSVAFVVSLLFGIHPQHVESVAWITERKDVLFTVFYLSALISYLFYVANPLKRLKYLGFTLGLFCLSLLSKAMAVTLPGILMVIDYYRSRKFDRSLIIEKIPFFVLAAVFIMLVITHPLVYTAEEGLSIAPFEKVLYASYCIIAYLYKLIVPFPLSCFYPFPEKTGGVLPLIYYLAPLFVLGLALFSFLSLRKTKDVVFGFLFFLVTISLLLKFYPSGDHIIADRYTYLPSIGIFYILAQVLVVLSGQDAGRCRRLKVPVLVLFVLYAVSLSVASWNRCKIWKDSISLWSDVLEKCPRYHVAYVNRGSAYLDEGQYDLAFADFQSALAINPHDYVALVDRGLIYDHRGQIDLAISDYSRAIFLNPTLASAYFNRGLSYGKEKRADLALSDYSQAIKINPRYTKAYYQRGRLLGNSRMYARAVADFSQVIKLDPQNAFAYYDRAVVYFNQHEYEKSLEDTKKAKSLGVAVDAKFLVELKRRLTGN